MRFVVTVAVLLAACGDSGPTELTYPDQIPSTCDPVDPARCALPFPSSHFLVKDESTATGVRVAFGDTTLPVNSDGIQVAPRYWNERDGFSINTPALFYLEGDTYEQASPFDDLDGFDSPDATTVIINTATGEVHPHWLEFDATAPVGVDGRPIQQLSLLRPAVPYEWNTRYVVAVRRLKNADGEVIPASEAFAALRDGTVTDDEALESRRDRYDDHIFPVLEAAGWDRADLQIAWDFHTASRENTLGRMEWMREDALAWVEENGWTYTVEVQTENDCSVEGTEIARDIVGTFQMPLYTLADAPEDPYDTELQAMLTRDSNGMPFRNGVTTADFMARIPCSVATNPTAASAPILQYGHGLLGGKGEAYSGWLADFANERGFVILALDWTGFMGDDTAGITFMLAQNNPERVNPSDFAIVSERSQMGMVEKVLGMRLMSTVLVDDPAFAFDPGEGDPVKVVDGSRRYYYGNSQGGIMGAAYLAFSPDIDRGVLGVPGGPYSLLLPRSKDFDPFFTLLKNKFSDHRDIMLFVAGLTQQLWDPTEPGGWVWDMTRDAAQPKLPLLQVAIYDNQVTSLGAHYMARAYGAITPADAVRPIWGVEEVDVGDGLETPAIVEWKYTDLPDEPLVTLPPGSKDVLPPPYDDGRNTDPHECPRREATGQEQAWTFLTTGKVVQTCPAGGCVSTVAAVCP